MLRSLNSSFSIYRAASIFIGVAFIIAFGLQAFYQVLFCLLIPHFIIAHIIDISNPNYVPMSSSEYVISFMLGITCLYLAFYHTWASVLIVAFHCIFSDVYLFDERAFPSRLFFALHLALNTLIHLFTANIYTGMLIPKELILWFPFFSLALLTLFFVSDNNRFKSLDLYLFNLFGVLFIYFFRHETLLFEFSVAYHVLFWSILGFFKSRSKQSRTKLMTQHLIYLIPGVALLFALKSLSSFYDWNFFLNLHHIGLAAACFHIALTTRNTRFQPAWMINLAKRVKG